MTDRELLQQALDALKAAYHPDTKVGEVMEAISARLAQPEPLAQFKFQEYGPPNWGDSQVTKPEFVAKQKAMNEALRTMVEPVIQARKEGDLIVVDLPQVPRGSGGITKDEQPEPEPVGWIGYFEGNLVSFLQTQEQVNQFLENTEPFGQVFPVYAAPPQRDWQGLTNEEIENCFEMSMFGTCRAIEAKLKDKNT